MANEMSLRRKAYGKTGHMKMGHEHEEGRYYHLSTWKGSWNKMGHKETLGLQSTKALHSLYTSAVTRVDQFTPA
jgi:hypothetical protein